MKKWIITGFLISALISCKSINSSNTKDEMPTKEYQIQMENISENIFFRANGNKDAWSLKMNNQKIILSFENNENENISFDYTKPNLIADGQSKMFLLQNNNAKMTIEITPIMSKESYGMIENYHVKLFLEQNAKTKSLEGNGNYIINSKLHDLWGLESMNGKKVDVKDFPNEFPRFEMNTNDKSFSGFGGCNTIRGNVISENEILKFTRISSTYKFCQDVKESEFVRILSEVQNYRFEAGKLVLSTDKNEELIFRKGD